MEVPIPYSQIEDVYCVSRWDSSQKFYIRIVIHDGSVLLQVSLQLPLSPRSNLSLSQLPNKWVRDQWLNSINWKVSHLSLSSLTHSLTHSPLSDAC